MSKGNEKQKSYEALSKKLSEENRLHSTIYPPYPKLSVRSERCNCNKTSVNQLKVGEPLPITHVDPVTGYVHFPKPNLAHSSKKGCDCSRQEECSK